MSFFATQAPEEDFDTPSRLAQELAGHKARYEAGRQNVIDRGTQKVEHLKSLAEEIEAERQAHEELLAAA